MTYPSFFLTCSVVFLLLIQTSGFSASSDENSKTLFLRLNIKDDKISVTSKELVEAAILLRQSDSQDGSILYFVTSASRTELLKGSFQNPLTVPCDYLDENGTLCGEIKKLTEATYDLRLPYDCPMESISFYTRTAQGTRGQFLGSTEIRISDIHPNTATPQPREGTLTFIQGDSTQKRCDYVILSEGYTQAELNNGKFLKDLRKGVDFHFTQTPFTEYKNHWNVWAISVPSSKSGFGGYFGSVQNGRLIYCPDLSKARTILKALRPTYALSCILVNVTEYGGAGSDIAVASIHESSGELIAHETGHGAFLLGDEYDYAGATPSETPNTTQETVRTKIKWKEWINSTTPVPTPETSEWDKEIGLFEGACYKEKGWYRPKNNCKMKAFNYSFCSVCCEATIATVYGRTTTYLSYSPQEQTIDYNNIPDKKLKVIPRQTSLQSVKVTWLVNGELQPESSEILDLATLPLKTGQNKIAALVNDASPFIRIPKNIPLLRDSIEWNVKYSGTEIIQTQQDKPFSFSAGFANRQTLLVTYHIGYAQTVSILLYSPKGTLLMKYSLSQKIPGNHSTALSIPSSLSAGVYTIGITSDSFRGIRKIAFVK